MRRKANTKNGAGKCSSCKATNGDTSPNRIPEISQHPPDDGQGSRTTDTGEKPADEDSADILSQCNRNVKEGQQKCAQEQWSFATKYFRQGTKHQRTRCETGNEERSLECGNLGGDMEVLGGDLNRRGEQAACEDRDECDDC